MKGTFTARERFLIYSAYGEAFETAAQIVDQNTFGSAIANHLRSKSVASYQTAADVGAAETKPKSDAA